jgi:ABC-type siderophore export system fused ATPase/permease subunit
MNKIIEKEFIDFEKYHRNIYNIYFHIICGFIFMAFLFLLSKNNSNLLLIIYSLLILFTTNNLFITVIIFIILSCMNCFIKNNKLSNEHIFLLFLVFYCLPDLSHYLTNEPPMLNIDNITLLSLFVNIFYLLPFSIMCLSNSK